MEKNKEILLEIKNLKQYFNEGKRNEVRAIEDISFNIYKGETLGLVGESGCGKSTTGKAIIKLNDITDGEILYEGQDIQKICLLYTSPSPRDLSTSRMPSSA